MTEQPTAAFIRASGKCAECHSNLQYSVVHEYELSVHARKQINCLECHQPATGQISQDHHGFVIATRLTSWVAVTREATVDPRDAMRDREKSGWH